jgi:hypothetical protein
VVIVLAETTRNSLEKSEGTDTLAGYILGDLNNNLDLIDAAIAKCNWEATVGPEATDDESGGYTAGSFWFDSVTRTLYLCTDATEDSAAWEEIWPVDSSGLGSLLTEAGDIPWWTGTTVAPLHHSTRGYALLSGGHGVTPYFDSFPVTGWLSVDDGWQYSWADAPYYGIYLSGDLTNVYIPGLKLKATQVATDRYFEVVSSEYTAPYTNVVLKGMVGSVLANAIISASYISFGVAPNGWPQEVTSGDWTAFSTIPVYVSWDGDTKTGVMKVEGADLTEIISTRDRLYMVQNATDKWFLVASVELSGSDTLITVYGGSEFILANTDIVGAIYSKKLSPAGFPTAWYYWDLEVLDTTLRSSAALSGVEYADFGSVNIILGIGNWELSLHALLSAELAEAGDAYAVVALSASSSEVTDSDLSATVAGGPLTWIQNTIDVHKSIEVDAKTTYYLVAEADGSDVTLYNDETRLRIVAKCLLL